MSDAKPPQVFEAISTVMGIMAKEGISKARRNSQQGYNFRGIDDVYAALCGVMADNKLVILPFVQDMQREERQTAKGGMLNYTILTVDFTFASAVDGSTTTVRMVGEAMDSADKSSNKAQSAALKYAALQVFMIPTEGDNDADATTHELAGKSDKQPAKEAPAVLTDQQFQEMVKLAGESNTPPAEIAKQFGVEKPAYIPQSKYVELIDWLDARRKPKTVGEDLNDEIKF